MRVQRLLGCALLLALAMTAAGGGSPPSGENRLAPDRLELIYPVQSLDRAGEGRFVRVDIASVTNPGRIPLAFQVFFQAAGGERTILGGFALFPADNPGRFIVPTQGLLRQDGGIVLTMEPLPESEAAGAVEVRVRALDLVDALD